MVDKHRTRRAMVLQTLSVPERHYGAGYLPLSASLSHPSIHTFNRRLASSLYCISVPRLRLPHTLLFHSGPEHEPCSRPRTARTPSRTPSSSAAAIIAHGQQRATRGTRTGGLATRTQRNASQADAQTGIRSQLSHQAPTRSGVGSAPRAHRGGRQGCKEARTIRPGTAAHAGASSARQKRQKGTANGAEAGQRRGPKEQARGGETQQSKKMINDENLWHPRRDGGRVEVHLRGEEEKE